MSEELKPCPFCGVVRGNHKDDCFLTLLRRVSRNTPTRITGNVSQSELDAAWNRRAAVELSDDELQKALKSDGMDFNIEFSRKLYNAIIAAHRSATNKENLLVQEYQE